MLLEFLAYSAILLIAGLLAGEPGFAFIGIGVIAVGWFCGFLSRHIL